MSLVSWAMQIAYMQCICVLCLYTGVYHIPRCTVLGCDQQILRYLAILGLLWVQLQGWEMGQLQLRNCNILYAICFMNCLHIVYRVLCGFGHSVGLGGL